MNEFKLGESPQGPGQKPALIQRSIKNYLLQPGLQTVLGLYAIVLTLVTIAPSLAAEKVLRVRYGGDISGIDPATIFQIENQTIALNVYNGLVRYDEKTNNIIPDLATEWAITDGGPTLGQHNHYVLGHLLGRSIEEIERLEDEGVV